MPIFADRVSRGFVFLDGEYLNPPYTIVETKDATALNGRMVHSEITTVENEDGLTLVTHLEQHQVVVLESGKPAVFIRTGSEVERFLESMISEENKIRMRAAEFSKDQDWSEWLKTFEPPKKLVTRAKQRFRRMRKVRESTHKRIRTTQEYASMGYVLTMVGMVLAVWALGHLLSSSPRPDEVQTSATPAIIRATKFSIVGVLCLSLLDLVWTLVASEAGQMRELNPLGSRMIDNPYYLVTFKLVATLIGCGVLYSTRYHQRARKAAWWMCLVLTVLTFRWLVFNSMQYGG